MRALFKLFFWLLFLSPFLLAGLGWFALAEQPLVLSNVQLSHADVARARAVIKQNDPRRLPAGTDQQVRVAESDLNLAANYLLQKVAQGGAQVRLHPDFADAVGTLRIPKLPVRPYLNITLQVSSNGGLPQIDRLQLGELDVPAPIARWLLAESLSQLYKTREYELASDVVQKLDLERGQLAVTYRWDPALIAKARQALLSNHDAAALRAYHDLLISLQARGIGTRGSLANLLKPMFAEAQRRSTGGDPVAENRALLSVLGAWSSGRGLGQLVPDASRQPKRFRLTLDTRTDFGQHFLTSAALAAQADAGLADAVGLYKEVADANGGSGFSFTDIAADRAGVRFGELAAGSPESARRLQNFMAAGPAETDIMPPARDLPEHMNAEQFEQRFGPVGSPRYRAVMDDIEQRIAACRLYHTT